MSIPASTPFTTDLFIDGRLFRVPHEVAAHVQFLQALNERFAHRLAELSKTTASKSFGRRGT